MTELCHIVPLYTGFCGWRIRRWHPFWHSMCKSGYKGHGRGQGQSISYRWSLNNTSVDPLVWKHQEPPMSHSSDRETPYKSRLQPCSWVDLWYVNNVIKYCNKSHSYCQIYAVVIVACCTAFFVFYGVHLHLQSGEQSGFALPQVQLEQSPLQNHLINSVHDLESCGIVI